MFTLQNFLYYTFRVAPKVLISIQDETSCVKAPMASFVIDTGLDYYMSGKSFKDHFTKETILKTTISTAVDFGCFYLMDNTNDLLIFASMFNLNKLATEALFDYAQQYIENKDTNVALETQPVEIIGSIEA
jgi:hypothetical protein